MAFGKGGGTLARCEDIFELGERHAIFNIVVRRRFPAEKLRELGVEVDEGLGDDLTFRGVREEEVGLREAQKNVCHWKDTSQHFSSQGWDRKSGGSLFQERLNVSCLQKSQRSQHCTR